MKIKTIMTSLLLATSAFASDFATFKNPDGFYQVQYPRSWKVETEGNITNIVTPDGEGAITISVYHDDSGDFKDLMNIARRRFAEAEVVSPFEALKTEKKKGIKGEFRTKETDGNRKWLVRAVHAKRVFVFITANDSENMFEQRRDAYLKVLESLQLKDPK
jgi:major membrane immunogen (membrane-anchored lipoprotein)